MRFAVGHSATSVARSPSPSMVAVSTSKWSTAPQRSRYFPFSPSPPNLQGYVGACDGFDPLQISSRVPMQWLREAELKQGRVAMLAVVGFIANDVGIKLDNGIIAPSIYAHDASLGPYGGPLGQVWSFVAVLELLVGLPAVYFMAAGGDRQPGDFNFDPLGINVGSQEQRDAMAMKELKHGRLAMLAFGGIVTQAGLGHTYFPYV